MRLAELATAVRTKNAGPCVLTIDLLFPDLDSYGRAAGQIGALTEYAARHYGVDAETLAVFACEPARAIKLTLPRDTVSGNFGDRDVYGAQQHRPMLEFEL